MNVNEFDGTERKLARLGRIELDAYRREQCGDECLDMDEDWDCENDNWPEDEEEDG